MTYRSHGDWRQQQRVADLFDTSNIKRQELLFHYVFPNSSEWQSLTRHEPELPEGEDDAALVASLRRVALVWEPVEPVEADDVTIERVPLKERVVDKLYDPLSRLLRVFTGE